MFQFACMVDPGVNRAENDDRASVNGVVVSEGLCKFNGAPDCLVVVCDGVGGAAFGGEAAYIVADAFSRLSGVKLSKEAVENYISKANEAVIAAQRADFRYAHMMTTIAGLYIRGSDFIAFNVGDTRVYRYRAPYLAQISRDHSVWQEQTDAGGTPLPEYKRTITRYLGGEYAIPEIVCGDGRALPNDVFMLCTDGVWGALTDDEIEGIITRSRGRELDRVCKRIVEAAIENGSDDNLSVILVRRID